jgi:hypothetical protein
MRDAARKLAAYRAKRIFSKRQNRPVQDEHHPAGMRYLIQGTPRPGCITQRSMWPDGIHDVGYYGILDVHKTMGREA